MNILKKVIALSVIVVSLFLLLFYAYNTRGRVGTPIHGKHNESVPYLGKAFAEVLKVDETSIEESVTIVTANEPDKIREDPTDGLLKKEIRRYTEKDHPSKLLVAVSIVFDNEDNAAGFYAKYEKDPRKIAPGSSWGEFTDVDAPYGLIMGRCPEDSNNNISNECYWIYCVRAENVVWRILMQNTMSKEEMLKIVSTAWK